MRSQTPPGADADAGCGGGAVALRRFDSPVSSWRAKDDSDPSMRRRRQCEGDLRRAFALDWMADRIGAVGFSRFPMLPGFGRVARDDPRMDRHFLMAPSAMETTRQGLQSERLMLD